MHLPLFPSPCFPRQDLADNGLYVQKAPDGVLSLHTINARREGETLCLLPSLIFDSCSKLETFLSTGGNKILVDRLVRVTGVLVQEGAGLQEVYAALVGAGRYIRHFLGVRKAGPNVAIVASPGHGASDQFLRLEVRTRNLVGIAARSIVVANFGVDWDASAVSTEVSETPAKRFRGMLDKCFGDAAGDTVTEAASSTGVPEDGGEVPKEEAKAKEEPADPPAEAACPPAKVPRPDGGEVLATLGDGCAAAGAMLIWRPEAGGSLSLRAGDGWAGNKKVAPKTTIWKVPDVKLDAKGEFLVWQLDGPKTMVFAGKGTTTLGEFIKQKAATSVARHTPETFPPGTPPNSLKATGNVRVGTSSSTAKKVLVLCTDNQHLGLMWMLGFKDQQKQVIPTGVMVYVKKQIIVPKDGEVRLS